MKLVTPNEMMVKAKEAMLEGKEPKSKHDWEVLLNYIAHNVAGEMEKS